MKKVNIREQMLTITIKIIPHTSSNYKLRNKKTWVRRKRRMRKRNKQKTKWNKL